MIKKISLFYILIGILLVVPQTVIACNTCSQEFFQITDGKEFAKESFFSRFTKDGSEIFFSLSEQLIFFLMSSDNAEGIELHAGSQDLESMQFAPSLSYKIKNNFSLEAGYQKSFLEGSSSGFQSVEEKKGDQFSFSVQYQF